MKKKKLNCHDRISILELLKSMRYDSNSIIFNVLHSLRIKLSFTEEEIERFGLHMTEETQEQKSTYQWNEIGFETIDIELTEKELELITKPLIQMEEINRLDPMFKGIHTKFIIWEELEDRIREID